jgi:hypothetical protein
VKARGDVVRTGGVGLHVNVVALDVRPLEPMSNTPCQCPVDLVDRQVGDEALHRQLVRQRQLHVADPTVGCTYPRSPKAGQCRPLGCRGTVVAALRKRDGLPEPRTVRLSDRQPRTTPPEIGSYGAV